MLDFYRCKLFQTVDIFDNVLFYRRECLVAYVVLELACVLDRDFFADTEADQQPATTSASWSLPTRRSRWCRNFIRICLNKIR